MAISSNFPTIRPALNLNFARTKTLDPRITFTRASIGTYVGSDGLIKTAAADEPRFDHDPITGTSLGLLVEDSRTNIHSSQGSLTGITNPRGSTGEQYFMNWNDTVYTVRRQRPIFSYTLSAGTYVFSFYVKPVGQLSNVTYTVGTDMGIVSNVNSLSIQFITLTGTISSEYGGNIVSPTVIQQLNNGWYRVSLRSTFTGSGTGFFYWYPSGSATTSLDTNTGFYVWGTQLELGSFPTSYIPTTNATVTRLVDNAVISGSNFTSLYNPNRFTLYGEGRSITKGQSTTTDLYALVSIDDNTTANRFTLRRSADVYQNTGYSGYTFRYRRTDINLNLDAFPPLVDSSGNLPLWNDSNIHKAIFAVNNNSQVPHDIAAYGDGVNANLTAQGQYYLGTEILSSFTAATQLSIGNAPGASPFNGHVTKIMYYPERLPNNQLQALTK